MKPPKGVKPTYVSAAPLHTAILTHYLMLHTYLGPFVSE